MGLFSSKKECSVCYENIGKIKIANDEYLCNICKNKMLLTNSTLKNMTSDQIKSIIEELDSFEVTKKVSAYLEIDEQNKRFRIPGLSLCDIYNFSDLIDFELLEDGESLAKGGLGRALVGGALFGGVGAVVGGVTAKRKGKKVCTSLKIKLTFNNIENSVKYIGFIGTPTPKSDYIYKDIFAKAQECLSLLQIMSNKESDEVTKNENISAADEILKFKKLLDEGIITKEEFEIKKKELLGV